MDKNEIARHANELDALSHEEDGVEYWLARDIMEHMGYSKWENFAKAVQRAKDACAKSGQQVEAHFRDTTRSAATVIRIPYKKDHRRPHGRERRGSGF